MGKIRVHFCEITDLNGQKHQIKTEKLENLINFMRRNKGKIAGINKGSRLVSEEKFKEIQREENFR